MIECHVRCDFCCKTGPSAMSPTDAKIVAHNKGWTIGKPHLQNRRDCCPWCMSKASMKDSGSTTLPGCGLGLEERANHD